jgi:galactonate dehydratase
MRITDYELFPVAPRWQLLKLETSDGTVGWGEPVVEGRAKTTAAAVEELLDSYLLGEDPMHIEEHWQRMYRGGFYRGGPVLMSALSGVDQALWDIKGKQYGAPVYDLLGGKARDRIRLYQHIGGETLDDLAESARTQVDAGFEVLKMTPTEELRRVDAPARVDRARERMATVREAVGPGVDVGLDFHGRVSKSMAKRLAAALEEFDPMFYEEPVLAEHNDALADLAAHTSVPIATGERMFSRWDFKGILAENAVDVIQPDLSHAGGITEVHKIAAMAEAYDVALAPHSPLGPVALAACLHVDACAPNALVQEQILHRAGVPTYLEDESPFDHEGGYVDLPPGPGLGVDPDEDALREAVVEDADVWNVPEWTHEDGGLAEW